MFSYFSAIPYILATENSDPQEGSDLGVPVEDAGFGFLLLVSGDCLKTNPRSLRDMSKGCPPLFMNSGIHHLSHAYLRFCSQMGLTSLVPVPLVGTADPVSARIPSISRLW